MDGHPVRRDKDNATHFLKKGKISGNYLANMLPWTNKMEDTKKTTPSVLAAFSATRWKMWVGQSTVSSSYREGMEGRCILSRVRTLYSATYFGKISEGEFLGNQDHSRTEKNFKVSRKVPTTRQLFIISETKQKNGVEPRSLADDSPDAPDPKEDCGRLPPKIMGRLRMILQGSLPLGKRLFSAKLRSAPCCLFCDSCLKENYEHVWWECPFSDEIRKAFYDEHPKETVDGLPNATRHCGIAIDDSELDEWFAKIALNDLEEKPPPQQE